MALFTLVFSKNIQIILTTWTDLIIFWWTVYLKKLTAWLHFHIKHILITCSMFNPSKHFNLVSTFVLRLIWRHDVRQSKINVETTLCLSTLEFKTLNKVESTLSILLIWTTLDNFETTLSFSASISAAFGNVLNH